MRKRKRELPLRAFIQTVYEAKNRESFSFDFGLGIGIMSGHFRAVVGRDASGPQAIRFSPREPGPLLYLSYLPLAESNFQHNTTSPTKDMRVPCIGSSFPLAINSLDVL